MAYPNETSSLEHPDALQQLFPFKVVRTSSGTSVTWSLHSTEPEAQAFAQRLRELNSDTNVHFEVKQRA